MIGEVIANTNVIRYLMAAMGILGVIAKLVNQVTLNRLIRAAGTMSKSTHRLIKLVKAKYEHACMVHDTVENTDAFVEKYMETDRDSDGMVFWYIGVVRSVGRLSLLRSSRIRLSIYSCRSSGNDFIGSHQADVG